MTLTYTDLVDYFQKGCKEEQDFRLGFEWEQFSYDKATNTPLAYYGKVSVLALFKTLIADFGWQPIYEGQTIIALKRNAKNGLKQTISLEPGGQIELSGALQQTLGDVSVEIQDYYQELIAAGDKLGIGFLAVGVAPHWTRDDFSLMPKQRYEIMTKYMPQKGDLGLDMMFRTCTMQLNMDYSSEQDMIQKMRVGMAFQPLATALFANSHILEGQDTGYASYRSHIWTDTDPDRTGILEFVFDDDFGFQRYTDYILDMPMYFIKRNDEYINCAGLSFRDFMQGQLEALPGEYPTLKDWEDHVSTAFPEVRLKTFLEMRGADSVPIDRVAYLSEFWSSLIYNKDCLQKCLTLIKNWPVKGIVQMRYDAAKYGMDAKTPDGMTLYMLYDALCKGQCLAA